MMSRGKNISKNKLYRVKGGGAHLCNVMKYFVDLRPFNHPFGTNLPKTIKESHDPFAKSSFSFYILF